MSSDSYRLVSVEELGVQIIRFTKRNALLEGVRREV